MQLTLYAALNTGEKLLHSMGTECIIHYIADCRGGCCCEKSFWELGAGRKWGRGRGRGCKFLISVYSSFLPRQGNRNWGERCVGADRNFLSTNSYQRPNISFVLRVTSYKEETQRSLFQLCLNLLCDKNTNCDTIYMLLSTCRQIVCFLKKGCVTSNG